MSEINQQIQEIRKAKEIADIISERDKVIRLLNENNEKELAAHLELLQQKYMAELLIYNLGKPNPPKSVYENAKNCIPFLDSILKAKMLESMKEGVES